MQHATSQKVDATMPVQKNILIFPAGSEIGLEIERSLRHLSHFRVYGATSLPDHSEYVFENMVGALPMFDDPAFLPELLEILERYGIDYIFPAHDELVTLLPRFADEGQLPTTVEIIGSSSATTEVARWKSRTYKALAPFMRTPAIFERERVTEADLPLFAKPDRGQGSRGAKKLNRLEDLISLTDGDIVCEFLPGDEFTVDCFTDRHGQLRYVSGRVRARISNGISVASRLIENEHFATLAEIINAKISLRGMWFFQVKESNTGELALLEVAPRVAGGMGFTRARGVNLPALAIYDRMNIDVAIFSNDIAIVRDSALAPSYEVQWEFDEVFVDLDDTLIFGDSTNADLISLLYHWRNQGKSIHLITRHRETYQVDPVETLMSHAISPRLFRSVIEVPKAAKKSQYIESIRSIFIDDSTAERFDVSSTLNVPTFTCTQACEIFRRGKGNF